MKPKIIFIILLLAVVFQPFKKSHSNTLAKCFIFPTDTIVFNDTLRLNDTLGIVKNRLMITDTFVNRVVVDKVWHNKTSSITDYIISPNDTIKWQKSFGNKPYVNIKQSPKMASRKMAKKKKAKAAKNDFLVSLNEEQTCNECEQERLAALAAEQKEQKQELATYTRKSSPVKEKANIDRTHQKHLPKKLRYGASRTGKADSTKDKIKVEVINNIVVGTKIKPDKKKKQDVEITFISIDQPLKKNKKKISAKENEASYPVKKISDLEGSSHISTRQISLEEAYRMTLRDINKERLSLARQYMNAKNHAQEMLALDKAAKYLGEVVANEVTYYWYGQRFDKEKAIQGLGSNVMPDSYFVVKMLTEVGLKADKQQLLRKNATLITQNLSRQSKRYDSLEDVKQLTKTKGTGLYIMAFNSYIAFLFNDGLDVYVIHALPQPLHTVARLSIDDAHFLAEATHYDVGKLSDNKELIRKWLEGKTIYF